jgi:hypothetical protein
MSVNQEGTMYSRSGSYPIKAVSALLTGALVFMFLRPAPVASGAAGLSAEQETACVDFESLTLGTIYHVGDVFMDAGVTITGTTFIAGGGIPITTGFAEVEDGGLAGGAAHELEVNNINLVFGFPAPLSGLSLHFGEYGGNLNININGSFQNFANFSNINGMTIGGVHVSVTNGLGNDKGVLILTGTIQTFSLGGQELWIDQLCPDSDCVDFEDPLLGNHYNVGDVFSDSGVQLIAADFLLSNGNPAVGGFAEIGNAGLAGGTGQEVGLNNISLAFVFPTSLAGLSLRFGEYGGNLNININNSFRNFNNFADLNGQVIGGVSVTVINGLGNDTGELILHGKIQSFQVGGQELWIDDACPLPGTITYLPLIFSNGGVDEGAP